MPTTQLPISSVSSDPSSGATRPSDGVQSHSRRSGSAADGGGFASVLARRSGAKVNRGTKVKPAPDPVAKVATTGTPANSSTSTEPGKAKSKTGSKDPKDSKAAAQAANVLLVVPLVSVASSHPSAATSKAGLQQIAKAGRSLPGQSGSLLPKNPGGDVQLIGKQIDTLLNKPAVILDSQVQAHGGAAKAQGSKLDLQGTDIAKLTVPSKGTSAGLLKNLLTQNLAIFTGSQQTKGQGQAGADLKSWASVGLVGSPIGLPITPTTTLVAPAATATNNFSNALANLYAGSTGWNTALGNEVAWMARGTMRQVRLRLYPQRLGSLDVHIQLQQQQVNIAFVVQHPAAAGAVQDALAQLGGMLAQQGLNLGDTQVSYGQSQASPAWPTAGKRNRGVDESGDITLSGLSRHGLGLFDDFA